MLASHYIETVEKHLASITDQIESIKQAAGMIARAVLGGNRVFVLDRLGILDAELVGRASGLALFRRYRLSDTVLAQGDMLIISAYESGNEHDLAELDRAHGAGALVVTIAPDGELAGQADVSLVNYHDSRNGVMTVPDSNQHFCPTNGILHAVLAEALSAETAAAILESGKQPTVYCGKHLKNGDERLSLARKRFSQLGY